MTCFKQALLFTDDKINKRSNHMSAKLSHTTNTECGHCIVIVKFYGDPFNYEMILIGSTLKKEIRVFIILMLGISR